MNKYEIMIIFDDEVVSFEENKSYVAGLFAENKVEILEEKDIGQRDLSFPINEKKRGHYYLYNIQAEAGGLPPVESSFKLSKGVMRYLVVRQK